MTAPSSSSTQPESAAPDFAAQWSSARRLHPIYAEVAREFVIDAPAFPALEEPVDAPDRETVEHAQKWLHDMDERIQVHQLRQFLQTSSLVDNDGLVALLQHFLAKTARTDSSRDKIDFLLVQYFSQLAPSELDDNGADLAYVGQGLEPVLGKVELKAPVWLNALDRVLDSARRCRSLDELLHGGVLEQGRKAKVQAGDLFYLPIALVAFTRFGYLMRRVFFRLMLTDLNNILDGLTELEEKGVETIDCRRAQFSAKEPIVRLRMICQSWKVMFQAEYSSGQPLRMLVDLRASVDAVLGRGSEAESGEKAAEATAATKAAPSKAVSAKSSPRAAGASETSAPADAAPEAPAKPKAKFAVANGDAPEFEVSRTAAEWNPDEDSTPGRKK
ncbi:MAG TPA: hypothetical protein VMU26_07680 [Candidatus Polarisedimenticolia bacterium]|nr:hypothetical protein [Candidatus Polarisedimenticolia bacterium]